MKELITWSEELEIGIEMADVQHKKLVELINELHEAMRERRGKEVAVAVLSDLFVYTRTHFEDEEELLKKHDYPGLGEQEEAHAAFVTKLLSFKEQHESGAFTLTIDMMRFLRQWLVQHIQGCDREYVAHLQERGVH